MRRSSDAERAEHAHLTSAQAEPTEDLLLATGQQRTDAAQARGDPKGIHLEIRTGRSPPTKHAIGDVFSHGPESYLTKTIDVSISLAR